MLQRIGLAALWFFAAWTAGAMGALVLDLGTWVAPVVAITAATAVFWMLGRPRRLDDESRAEAAVPGASSVEA